MIRTPLALCAAAFVLLVACGTASADPGSFATSACYQTDSGSNTSIFETHDTEQPAFGFFAWCPDMYVYQQDVATAGTVMREIADVGTNLIGLSFSLTGGPASASGVSVWLEVCSRDECGGRIFADPDAGAQSYALSVGAGIPENPVTIRIEEQCTVAAPAVCESSDPTIFSDMKLTFADTADPTVEVFDPWFEPFPENPEWRSELPYFYVTAHDPDSFIASISVNMGGNVASGECPRLEDGTFTGNCELLSADGGYVYFPDDAQGVVPVTVDVADPFGHSASASFSVRRDTIPPEAPADLSVGANDAGLVAGNEVTARWNNPTESSETATESGVAKASYVLKNADGQRVQNGTEEGVGIDQLKLQIGYPGSYTLQVKTIDAAGNEGASSEVAFTLDLLTPVPPRLNSVPDVNVASAETGVTVTWSEWTYWDASFSGICAYRLTVNSLPHSAPVGGVSEIGLPADATSYELTPEYLASLPDRPRYVHLRSESCAGAVGAPADAALKLDRLSPEVSATPSTGWLAPGKALKLVAKDPDPDNPLAGIASITFSVDGESAQTAIGSSTNVNLGQGIHSVDYFATDRLGNTSEPLTIETGVDAVAPSAAFDAEDPADPALIRAAVSDPDSGVSDAWLEFSPPGSLTWARLNGSSSGAEPRALEARFPDDESLPAGDYRLRIVARDNAGNTSFTSTRIGGSEARVTLPLRSRPSISLAVAAGPSRPLSNSLTVPFGSGVQARGTLLSPSGAPVPGAEVSISETVPGGSTRRVAEVRTDASGGFTASLGPGPSRVVEARFAGDTMLGSAAASATFNVRARVVLRKLPKAVGRKKRFYVRGHIDPGAAALPRLGALVALQHLDGRRWSGSVSLTRTASDGSFAIRWPFRTRRGPVRFTVRVAAIAESGWPYANGYSPAAKVVVR